MKILYVSTISNTVNAFLIPHIKMLFDEGHTVDVAFSIEQEIDPRLIEMGCIVHLIPFKRSPLDMENLKAYRRLKQVIETEGYNLVHTHTPVASALTRLVCRNNNVKVVYTAHGFHFFGGSPIFNWIFYYPIEKILSRFTDVLITINEEDFNRAQKSFHPGMVKYLPGVGIDVKEIKAKFVDRKKKLRDFKIPEESFILLSIGELNKNKNHSTVIKALAILNNPNIHYLICGQGCFDQPLKGLIQENKLTSQVHLLGYRRDVIEICKASDVFIFPSYREGLSVSVMEAMACGLPVVCSNIRGNTDLIEQQKGGYLIGPADIENWAGKIDILERDIELRKSFGGYNARKIEKFSIENVLEKLKEIYQP